MANSTDPSDLYRVLGIANTDISSCELLLASLVAMDILVVKFSAEFLKDIMSFVHYVDNFTPNS